MIDTAKRFAAAALMTARKIPQRARAQLYGGAFGVRIMTLHDVPPHHFDRFCRLIDKCIEEFEMVGPEIAEVLYSGRSNGISRDKLLITFDDGFVSNFEAAKYLAKRKVRAIFFIVPSFIDRTMQQYLDFHTANGIEGFRFKSRGDPRGLSRTQVLEMVDMGHEIGGHNFAHRDMGPLTSEKDLEYEIDRAVEGVKELTGRPCRHFAFGFGYPRYINPHVVERMQRCCRCVYAAVRGLNVSGITPQLLLRGGTDLEHPFLFQQLCLRGGIDLHWASEVAKLKQLSGTLPAANAAI